MSVERQLAIEYRLSQLVQKQENYVAAEKDFTGISTNTTAATMVNKKCRQPSRKWLQLEAVLEAVQNRTSSCRSTMYKRKS